MSKKKILWSGDIVARTGFARVTENLITRLKDKYEIVVLGNNWWGDANQYQKDFKLYPSSNRFQTEPFGVQRIREVCDAEKPDIVFVNNDAWIVNQIYAQIKDFHGEGRFKFCAYMPMDSYGWTGVLNDHASQWDSIITYTEFGAKEFHAAGVNKPVTVIPHGITANQFYELDKIECRKRLGIPEDSFIVFNGNRNQARKRIDITIDAFAQFAVNKPTARLYLHMGMKDQGWDVMNLFGRQMRRYGIDPTNRIVMTSNDAKPPSVPVEILNVIYNACDVGVNTCKGEGHGLVNHEHAACRIAQVVPNHTACKEIFEGAGLLIENGFIDVDMNYNRDMPIPDTQSLVDHLNVLYEDEVYRASVADACYNRATDSKYQWDNVAQQFANEFEQLLTPSEELEVPVIKRPKRRKKVQPATA